MGYEKPVESEQESEFTHSIGSVSSLDAGMIKNVDTPYEEQDHQGLKYILSWM